MRSQGILAVLASFVDGIATPFLLIDRNGGSFESEIIPKFLSQHHSSAVLLNVGI
jgi:hypothetical protein